MNEDKDKDSFAGLLREVGEHAATPDSEALYQGALHRGHRIRRRRALGAGAGSVLAIGAVGALAFTLVPGSAGSSTVATAASSGTAPTATARANPGVSAGASASTSTSASASARAGLSNESLVNTFLHALPTSADPLKDASGGTSTSAFPPYVNQLSGIWEAGAQADLKSTSQTGWSAVSFNVEHGIQITTCTEAEAGSTTDTCTVSALDSGTLILDKTWHNPADPGAHPIWQYFWYGPAGYETTLSIGDDSVASFALTETQAESVLTNLHWAGIAALLPAKTGQSSPTS